MEGTSLIDQLRLKLVPFGQLHLIQFWDELSSQEQQHLYDDIMSIDFEKMSRNFEDSYKNAKNKSQDFDITLEPIPPNLYDGVTKSTPDQLKDFWNRGLKEAQNGHVAALLLAGGQGTRLGVTYPKGMYDVGLPSGKTLYQLQAERLIRLQHLAGPGSIITWYIMTSEHTIGATKEFFEKNHYFGLDRKNIVFFEQNMIPCFDFDGKIILESKSKIARAPDGNGGLYCVLESEGILADMAKRGIKYIHVYCVDNILVRMADPTFIGYCISKNANCGAKVVKKSVPDEAVGVVCKVNDKYKVVEYSELPKKYAELRNSSGDLEFCAGNICNHFFTLDFLEQMARGPELYHHVAIKKIPHIDDAGNFIKPLKPNGVKLEKFVFDVFEFSDKFVCWEVLREEEFSPLKNAEGASKDTPTTTRRDLLALHRHLLQKAGALLVSAKGDNEQLDGPEPICEISPLLSYFDEGLKELYCNKEIICPTVLEPYHQNGTLE